MMRRTNCIVIGEKYGRLTPLNVLSTTTTGLPFTYKCACNCGNYVEVKHHPLATGAKRSCGCIKIERAKALGHAKKNKPNGKNRDLTGKRFGNIVVLEQIGFKMIGAGKDRRSFTWKCLCDCGKECTKSSSTLLGSDSLHCGCLSKYKRRISAADRFPTALFNSYSKKARKRNLEFNLTYEQFSNLIKNNCYYCGKPPSRVFGGSSIDLCGVDRKNNSIGYTVENSVSCCKGCNIGKGTMTDQEFIAQSIRIAKLHGNDEMLGSSLEYIK